VPQGRVIVKEFESGSCNPPGAKNAWDTLEPQEGAVVCQDPTTVRASANVLNYVPCEKVDSQDCPLNRNGTANALVLRTPAQCLAMTAPQGQALFKLAKLRTGCDPPVFKGSDPIRHDFDVVVGRLAPGSAGCTAGAYIFQQVDEFDSFLVRTDPNKPTDPIGVWARYDKILRRLRDKNCPAQIELNAIVVNRMGRSFLRETICFGSPYLKVVSLRFGPLTQYFHEVYNEDCGGAPPNSNAYYAVQVVNF